MTHKIPAEAREAIGAELDADLARQRAIIPEDLIASANAILTQAGPASGDGVFLAENARRQLESTEW